MSGFIYRRNEHLVRDVAHFYQLPKYVLVILESLGNDRSSVDGGLPAGDDDSRLIVRTALYTKQEQQQFLREILAILVIFPLQQHCWNHCCYTRK